MFFCAVFIAAIGFGVGLVINDSPETVALYVISSIVIVFVSVAQIAETINDFRWKKVSKLNEKINQLTEDHNRQIDNINKRISDDYNCNKGIASAELKDLFALYKWSVKQEETSIYGSTYTFNTDTISHDVEQFKCIIEDAISNKYTIKSKYYDKFIEQTKSNLTAIPYMAGIVADYETYGLELLAQEIDWGYNKKRSEKVKSIREIRKDAQAMIERNKEAQYQLAYLLNLFPALQDVIECEFSELPIISIDDLSEHDRTRDFLSKEEYLQLSVTERNQLALDRYKNSHNKSKWQIGRDYELYVGYKYTQKGFAVDYFGSYMGLEDLGRDLIAKKGEKTLIIQCKYWSSIKNIHEKHINQLYGTMISYCIENNVSKENVKGILITNITLSDMAKKMANYLGIEFVENFSSGDYPCIKCNIGKDEFGNPTKIYHLPFDQQYDSTKITEPGEFYATTVAEAENAGFRRAFKHFG